MSKKVLIIGPRLSRKNGVGGVVVLFELFIAELEKKNIQFTCIDTNKSNYGNPLIAYVMILLCFLQNLRNCAHITLHGTAGDYKYIAPIVVFFAKAFNKKVSLRKFAGSFIEVYETSSLLSKLLIRYSLKGASSCFFETKYLVSYFEQFNPNTYWFPNVREKLEAPYTTHKHFSKKFIFVGQVKETKGVLDLVKSFEDLPTNYTLDIYGPLEIDGFKEQIQSYKNIAYCGLLTPNEVAKTMAKYDVFVMPTFHPGEGYPGVIIEAFSAGLPIISTSLDGIKEIVQDGVSGILVEPKNIDQIKNAVLFFDESNYGCFSTNALKAFINFDSSEVTDFFFKKACISASPKSVRGNYGS